MILMFINDGDYNLTIMMMYSENDSSNLVIARIIPT